MNLGKIKLEYRYSDEPVTGVSKETGKPYGSTTHGFEAVDGRGACVIRLYQDGTVKLPEGLKKTDICIANVTGMESVKGASWLKVSSIVKA